MKSVHVDFDKESKAINAKVVDIDVPTPAKGQVLIKIVVSGSNPKDWKLPLWLGTTGNTGDDIAGTIEKVGEGVTEFKVGDRVGAFHEMQKDHGSFAEYGIAEASTTFHLPSSTTFEQAATIPLAYHTAVVGLFDRLALPTPLKPADKEIPLLIYGASSAVGAFAIKLAKLANIHPIIGVAGSGSDFAKKIGCDIVVDRRNDQVVEDIKKALGGKELLHVYDAISEGESIAHIAQVLGSSGKVTTVLPTENDHGVTILRTIVGDAHDGLEFQKDLAYTYYRLASKWLAEGRLEPHPYEVVAGGLGGVEEGLLRLQKGEVSSKKLVFLINETEGL